MAHIFTEKLWPGPLTVVMQKKPTICGTTTCNKSTVCIRIPNHPFTRQLLQKSGVPMAGPSANKSKRPSSTEAEHVLGYFKYDDVLVIDDTDENASMNDSGNDNKIGIESTIIRFDEPGPTDEFECKIVILRQGGNDKFPCNERRFREIWGEAGKDEEKLVVEDKSDEKGGADLDKGSKSVCPGNSFDHYMPRAPLQLLRSPDGTNAFVNEVLEEAAKLENGKKIGVAVCEDEPDLQKLKEDKRIKVRILAKKRRPSQVGKAFFGAMIGFDQDNESYESILMRTCDNPNDDANKGVINRTSRAANGNIKDCQDEEDEEDEKENASSNSKRGSVDMGRQHRQSSPQYQASSANKTPDTQSVNDDTTTSNCVAL